MTDKKSRNNSEEIIVLGGGVSGLSTAIILLLLGLRVKLVASDFVGRTPVQNGISSNGLRPGIASNYAMASAYPHNLLVKNLTRISDDSQSVFAFLHANVLDLSAVELHRLYEVFEAEPGAAPLSERRLNFREFSGQPSALKSLGVPARPGANYLWGFCFDTYFADMPRYMGFLWALFDTLGGQLIQKSISDSGPIHDISGDLNAILSSKVLVNCLGLGAIKVFSDKTVANVMRGQQVIVSSDLRPVDNKGRYLAYNYTPTAEIYSRFDGSPEYVHFFSRADGWILGQTRESGQLTADGQWIGEPVVGPTVRIAEEEVAQPILSLNDELLFAWQGLHLPEAEKLTARHGLRYYRDSQNTGVRLESQKLDDLQIVHNYGHGGSGITMSWGCAIEAARQVFETVNLTPMIDSENNGWIAELAKMVLNTVAI